MQRIIEIKQVSMQYDLAKSRIQVLSDINLAVCAGERVAVIGPSVSGKTTLLLLLAGLEKPTQGAVILDGVPLAGLDPDRLADLRRDRLGIVFQSFHLLPSLDARHGVRDPRRFDRGESAAPAAQPVQGQRGRMSATLGTLPGWRAPLARRIESPRVQAALGLDAAQTATVEREADALAEAPLVESSAATTAALRPDQGAVPGAVVAAAPNVSEAEIDKSILNYSILNGALELLPQSWASMAIIPLQIKMVYRIGQAYGVDLDKGHIKEFLATVGVGLTSQYLEQIGRKLLGGLLGRAAGRLAGSIGGAATGVAFSFATTYALGQIAKRYYAGGRQMSTAVLQDTYRNLLGPAKQLQAQYLPQIEQKAGTIDATQIMALVRGA